MCVYIFFIYKYTKKNIYIYIYTHIYACLLFRRQACTRMPLD